MAQPFRTISPMTRLIQALARVRARLTAACSEAGRSATGASSISISTSLRVFWNNSRCFGLLARQYASVKARRATSSGLVGGRSDGSCILRLQRRKSDVGPNGYGEFGFTEHSHRAAA